MKFFQVCRCLCIPCLLLKRLWCWLFLHQTRRNFILIMLAIYIITFVIIFPVLMRDVPLTTYYRWVHKNEEIVREARKLNRKYADFAESQLVSLSKEATKRLYEESSNIKDLEFVVGVITRRRGDLKRQPQYLTQVMLSLHEALHHHSSIRATMFMCNTNQGNVIHEEAIALSDYFPIVDIKTTHGDNEYEREKLHYAACLVEAQKFSSKYVLLLQDDALPHKDFLSVVKYIIDQKINAQKLHGHHHQDDWLWMKLNFSNSLSKFHGNYFFALEWVSLCAILSSVFLILFASIHSMCCGNERSHENFVNQKTSNVHNSVRYIKNSILGSKQPIVNGEKHIGNGFNNNEAQPGAKVIICNGFTSFSTVRENENIQDWRSMHEHLGNGTNVGRCTVHNENSVQPVTLKPRSRYKHNYYAIFLAAFAYFMLLLDVCGRGLVNLPRYYSESFYALGPGTSCCLPAVVYPGMQIPPILEYLDSVVLDADNPLDFAMDDYRQNSGLRQFLVNPNIFSHIGFFSALHGATSVGAAEDYMFSMKILRSRLPSLYQE